MPPAFHFLARGGDTGLLLQLEVVHCAVFQLEGEGVFVEDQCGDAAEPVSLPVGDWW